MKKELDQLVEKFNEINKLISSADYLQHYIRNQVDGIITMAKIYTEYSLKQPSKEKKKILTKKLIYNYELLIILESKISDPIFLSKMETLHKAKIQNPEDAYISLGIINKDTLQIIDYDKKENTTS